MALVVKNLLANAGDLRDSSLTPGEEMATHSSFFFLPGESYGQRSLLGYGPLG